MLNFEKFGIFGKTWHADIFKVVHVLEMLHVDVLTFLKILHFEKKQRWKW